VANPADPSPGGRFQAAGGPPCLAPRREPPASEPTAISSRSRQPGHAWTSLGLATSSRSKACGPINDRCIRQGDMQSVQPRPYRRHTRRGLISNHARPELPERTRSPSRPTRSQCPCLARAPATSARSRCGSPHGRLRPGTRILAVEQQISGLELAEGHHRACQGLIRGHSRHCDASLSRRPLD
jgi:hypothetical protein